MKFRKKPVVIEAMQFTGTIASAGPILLWMGPGRIVDGLRQDPTYEEDLTPRGPGWIMIPTLEGRMRADAGDWIIKGVKGEVYPCKPDIFEATYEAVEVAESAMG